MPSSWGHQLASDATGILDDDGTHAVALDPIQKGREPRTCLDRVRTGDCRIIELFDDSEPGALGEALNGVALAFPLSLSVPTLTADEEARAGARLLFVLATTFPRD